MERLRPERRPRVRVQKVWRSVCWADSFSEESLVMDTIDITPEFALRKIATLFENRKYDDCASLIRRLSNLLVQTILNEVPIDVIHEALPQSACIIEALYVKVYHTSPRNFPTTVLDSSNLVKKMVCIFAQQFSSQKRDKNSNTFLPSFRTVLGIIMAAQPDFQKQIVNKKKSIDKCLTRLGQHGMVDTSGGRIMNLHDALKVEFDKAVSQFKCAIQKLEELSLTAKHPTSSSVTSGKAPTSGSHQRLMQVTRDDVQDRLIKNKTLLNAVDPAVTNLYLKHLIEVLQFRIEYDKLMLFHDTELRKMSEIADGVYLSVTMRQFSQGYGALLQIVREITGDDCLSGETNGSLSSSDDDLLETSVLRLKVSHHSNGAIPNSCNNIKPSTLITGVERLGHRCKPNQSQYMEPTLNSKALASRDVTSSDDVRVTKDEVAALRSQVDRLRLQVADAHERIRNTEMREAQLKERLSEHVHRQFTVNSGGFENITSGAGKRPTELIRNYGNLYTDGRVDAMDALGSLPPLADLEILKMKILFSVIVLSFRAAEDFLRDLKYRLQQVLRFPNHGAVSGNADHLSRDLDRHIGHYLSQTADRFDLSKSIQDVCEQIYLTLYDYPCLKDCPVLVEYIRDCITLAWSLTVLNPAYAIVYDSRTFISDAHSRFHTSDAAQDQIHCFLWPSLVEQSTGVIVHKGVVIT